MEKVKVLITGQVNNDFPSLISKLSSLEKSKAGPFHVCFCVGPFFGSTLDKANEDYQKAKNFLDQGSPIPVYFCDAGSVPPGLLLPSYELSAKDMKDEAEILLDDETKEDKKESIGSLPLPNGVVKIAHNIFHLHGISHESSQTADILNINVMNDEKKYLTVAFLPPNTRMGTPQTSKFEAKANHPSYVGCDVLLTSEWGQGMAGSSCLSNEDRSKLRQNYGTDQNLNEIGSFDVAEIVSQCRPRYHFAPSSSAICDRQNNNAEHDGSFFLQSLPYTNPPSALASGVIKNYHTSRFLALCQVVDSKKAKLGGKCKKFVHALGIQPLWSMDRATATAVPDNIVVVPSPYTDEKYGKDDIYGSNGSMLNAGNDSGKWKNVGLSEAQTRRILCEENTDDQYRWNIRNRKRPLDATIEDDPTNCTLFLHGLHNDVTKGDNLNRGSILNAFQLHGCRKVRYPGNDSDVGMNGRQHSYCFLEFSSHDDALECLAKTGGTVEISGIGLTLKWSSGPNRSQKISHIPPPPPKNFTGIMMPNDSLHRQKKQRSRLTEEEAIDSSSLFIYLKAKASTPEQYKSAILKLGELAQTKLEDAINVDSSDRVTADEEPALKVSAKSMVSKQNCGFLEFASHAAASMALATLTGSTNGGQLVIDFDQDHEFQDMFKNVELWWSKKSCSQHNVGSENGHNFQQHHFPPDARTDCWFCLASPTCEKHLIVNLANYSYVTMPKGPVNQNHVLIVPINHSSSENTTDTKKKHIIGALLDPDNRVVAEIEDIKEKIRMHAKTVLEKDLFVFERAIPTKGGYHAHINCIPIERGLGQKLRSTMVSMAATKSKHCNGFELREIQNPDIKTTTLLRNDDDLDGYFYAEIFEGNDVKRFLYKFNAEDKSTKSVPLEFGRAVYASVVNDLNLASWKGCVLEKKTEEEYTTQYRLSFEDFDQ